MILRHNVLLALALSGLGSVAPEAELRFAPQEGLELRRQVSGGIDLEFELLESILGGQSVPQEYLPDIEMEIVDHWSFEVEDRYVRMGPGRPETLERHYIAAESAHERRFSMASPMGEPMDESSSWESPSLLEGRRVRFQYDAREEVQEPAFIEDDGPEHLLENLWEDMDWRAFLPEDEDLELAVGTKWECSAQAARDLIYPGGDPHWEPSDLADEREMVGGVGDVSGALSARVAKLAGRAGLCTIEIRGELQTVHVVASDLRDIPVADGTATITTTATFEVRASLVWNLRDHHAQSMVAEADVRIESETVKDEGQSGVDFESVLSLAGTWKLAMEIENLSSE